MLVVRVSGAFSEAVINKPDWIFFFKDQNCLVSLTAKLSWTIVPIVETQNKTAAKKNSLNIFLFHNWLVDRLFFAFLVTWLRYTAILKSLKNVLSDLKQQKFCPTNFYRVRSVKILITSYKITIQQNWINFY